MSFSILMNQVRKPKRGGLVSLNYQVAASNCDSNQTGSTNAIVTTPLTSITANTIYNAWRFPSVTIPVGATIIQAYLKLYFTDEAKDAPDVLIYGEDAVTAPAVFTTDSENISARTKSTAYATWTNAGLGTAPAWYNTPSLVAVVTELVASYDYSGGRHMAFIMVGRTAGPAGATSIQSYDGSAALAAKLHIAYRP